MSLLLSSASPTAYTFPVGGVREFDVGQFKFKASSAGYMGMVYIDLLSYNGVNINKRLTNYSFGDDKARGYYNMNADDNSFYYGDPIKIGPRIRFSDSVDDALRKLIIPSEVLTEYDYPTSGEQELVISPFTFKIKATGTTGRVYVFMSKYGSDSAVSFQLSSYSLADDKTSKYYLMRKSDTTFTYQDTANNKIRFAATDSDILYKDLMRIIERKEYINEEVEKEKAEAQSSSITVSPGIKQYSVSADRYKTERQGLDAFTKPLEIGRASCRERV